MSFSEQEIEWIVVEVIRRLGLLTGRGGAAAIQHGPTTAELALNDKVITLRTVEGKLTGLTRLLVHPQAIVTPAVRDELKQRKIELIRQAGK